MKKRKKKVSIIGTNGLPANYGGWETLVHNLTLELNEEFEITVYCSGKSYDKRLQEFNDVKLIYIDLNANGWQSIPYDVFSMIKAIKHSDTLLILGVSGCLFLPFIKPFTSSKFIVNIDGLEWKRDKWSWGIKRFLKLSEAIAAKYADCVISDNKVIQDYAMSEYNIKSELISYGADHAQPVALTKEIAEQYPFLNSFYAFKVCRIEPENNLDMILEACVAVPTMNLVMVGNWSKSQYGENLRKKYSDYSNLFLLDPMYDQNILNQLRSNCLVYIHGHSAGGTNPSLVEAMHLGLPIVSYDVAFNKETTHHKAVYFHTTEDLQDILTNMDNLDLTALGLEMKELADTHYTWSVVSQKYKELLLKL
ncbi:MAG: DUF1972 domain-containing protein [Legionella sp.]|nr:DUF1972 domain-containing protein [Legionella sp.]